MKQRIFSDYGKIDFSTSQGREKVFAALQYFASGTAAEDRARKVQAALQALGTSGDFPAAANQILEKFHAIPSYDNGFEEIFHKRKISQMATSRESGPMEHNTLQSTEN